ncbi:acyl-CoA/acyl-ACP dehydrogenase [Epilithonimonas sp. JDS]|uniref:acyl-CoA dehydrogenase family protein n=1 Tax=Epilithonimonas sp. JDS TaxID=2902797 RepID=UPI001E5DA3C1|nr:acyl-CoA dehydrogenase family protein [Epilithonimonas sp. JDS]MCD9856652.1 acyl-CoA/acyl-ACP dehydrogenase [Epilithonimonas sp. JDS]
MSKLSDLVLSSQILGKASIAEAAKTDSVTSFPEKTLVKLKSSRLLTASIPEEFGGLNLGLTPGTNLALLNILKNIGKGNLVMGRILEGHINAQILINQFGNVKQKKLFSSEAFEGHLFGVWNTQATDGTYFSKSKRGVYFLNGSKTFTTGAGYVTRPIVTAARKDGSWQMCVVPFENETAKIDSSWWNPMGMQSSRSFKTTFTKTNIPKINLLGSPGEYYQQPGFSGGSVRFAAVQLGGAEQLLDETKAYLVALDRIQDPFQKMRLGQMAIAIESGNQWLNGAAVKMDDYLREPTKRNGEDFIFLSNMMRTAIEQICTDVMILCQKSVGARGLNRPYHFERIIRDLSTYLRQPAPDAVLTEIGSFILNSDTPATDIWNQIKK